MDALSNLNDVLLSPLGLAPLACAVVALLLARERTWALLGSLRCSNRLYVIALALSALALTVAFAFLQPKVIPWGGDDRYFSRALNIVEYGVFGIGAEESALFPPGYSFLLVPLAALLEGSRWAFFLTNIILLLGTSVVFRQMLMLLGASEGTGNTFSLVFHLYPNRLLSTLLPFSDVPFTLLFVLAFAAMFLSQKRGRSLVLPLLTGLLAGAAALVRSVGLLLLVPLVLGFLVPRKFPPAERVKQTLVMLLAAGALLLPWTLRNYAVFHRLIPISNNGGLNLALGNNPAHPIVGDDYSDSRLGESIDWREVGGTQWDESQRDSFFAVLGLRYIRENPVTFARLVVERIARAMAADSYTFGQLETYTNARTLVYAMLGEKRYDAALRQPLGALFTVAYHLLFVLNNTVYYVLLFLVVLHYFRPEKQARFIRTPYLAVVVIVWFTIALTFGLSRFKEPVSALLPLIVCMRVLEGRKNLPSRQPPENNQAASHRDTA